MHTSQQQLAYSARHTNTPIAIALWVFIILMGSSGLKEPVIYFVPAATPGLTVAWLGLYAIATLALFRQNGIGWIYWLFRYRLLLTLALIGAACSAFWAVDMNLSLQRSVHLIGCSLLAVYIGFALSLAVLLRTLLWTAGATLAVSLMMVYAQPELGIHAYEGDLVWRGIFANKNSLGFFCTMTVALSICLLPKETSWKMTFLIGLITVLGIVSLFQSKSATSVLSLFTGLSVAGIIVTAQRLRLGLAQQALLAILASATVILLIQSIDTHWLNSLLGRTGNLTGRGEVWAQTWALILERPLGGYGYGNLWNPTESTIWIQKTYTNFSWIVYHAHNGFLQIASEIGLVLATIAVFFVLQQLLESIHCQNQQPKKESLFVVVFSVAFLLSNYSEARAMIDRDIFWILFLAMPISLLLHPPHPEPLPEPTSNGHLV